MTLYLNSPVTGVDSKLNSATGTPLLATCGANMAAGYTTEDVPTTIHKSHLSNSMPVSKFHENRKTKFKIFVEFSEK